MQEPKITELSNYEISNFLISSVFLSFDIQEERVCVRSVLNCERNPRAPQHGKPLFLNGEDLTLVSVHFNGVKLESTEYTQDALGLSIPVAETTNTFTLETMVFIHPWNNQSLMGLYVSKGLLCTQCEPEGFRRITYFIDRPDIMTRFTVEIVAHRDQYPILLSNGNLVSLEERNASYRALWKDPSLKPCYLFALVAGHLSVLEDQFVTRSGRTVDLKLYAAQQHVSYGHFALEALKRAMRFDEITYQREYDLDLYMIVAIEDFNMGAMENKGLNIFNTQCILANPHTATDADYLGIASVVAHEYFHNWTGNRITCRDWFQLSLKEGLTVFREQHFMEHEFSAAIERLDSAHHILRVQFSEDDSPRAHPVRPNSYIEINNFYTTTIYEKGSEIIRMMRTLLGDAFFYQGMQFYFHRHDGSAVTIEDFVQAMEDASGMDLTEFKNWYHTAGTPHVCLDAQYQEESQELIVRLKQGSAFDPHARVEEAMTFPLCIGFIEKESGEALPTQCVHESLPQDGTRTLHVQKLEESWTFVHVQKEPVLSVLRGFSAPINLYRTEDDATLLHLMRYDTDAFARFSSARTYLSRLILRVAQELEHGLCGQIPETLYETYEVILKNTQEQAAYLARLLLLPDCESILRMQTGSSVEWLYRAHVAVQKSLGIALRTVWQSIYAQWDTKNYIFTTESIGQRALKALALRYLVATEDPVCDQMAYTQFSSSTHMTDIMNALMALNNRDCAERDLALDLFYQRFSEEARAVNQWLRLHASSTLPNTLHAVTLCMQHESFDLYNPNRVYALLGGLGANFIRFHEADGSAYAFLADQVVRIDRFNSQVAGRIVDPLLKWTHLDGKRQELMKKELKRIAEHTGLSKEVYELVSF